MCSPETQNSFAVALFGTIFVVEIEKKQELLCLKCKYININLFFNELCIKFAFVLIFGEKCHSSCDIISDNINIKDLKVIQGHFSPLSCILWELYNYFNRLNHAEKE